MKQEPVKSPRVRSPVKMKKIKLIESTYETGGSRWKESRKVRELPKALQKEEMKIQEFPPSDTKTFSGGFDLTTQKKILHEVVTENKALNRSIYASELSVNSS